MTGTGNGLCKLNPATGLSLEAALAAILENRRLT